MLRDYTAHMIVDPDAEKLLAEHGIRITPGQSRWAGTFMDGPERRVRRSDAVDIINKVRAWRERQHTDEFPADGAPVVLLDGTVTRMQGKPNGWKYHLVGGGSFYLFPDGAVDWCGAAGDPIENGTLVRGLESDTAEVEFWTFIPSLSAGAGCGVRFMVAATKWYVKEA